jgi:hypothetical protein
MPEETPREMLPEELRANIIMVRRAELAELKAKVAQIEEELRILEQRDG